MIYSCCDKKRRDLVDKSPTLNGIDYLEVVDGELDSMDALRQRTLLVHCLKPLPASFSVENVRLLGGERIRNIQILWVAVASPLPTQLTAPAPPDTANAEFSTLQQVQALTDADKVLVVRTAEAGDYSTYTLQFVTSPTNSDPPTDFDPQMSAIDFSFKVDCPSDFDCQPSRYCQPPEATLPDIDYLAKDYASFRRLLLDRMAQLAPDWQQSSEADFGVATAELLAYVGDHLSYQQDAVATEAYLNTARRRVSLRRHAVLVDYPMHDGCNARAWLQLQLAQGIGSFALNLVGTQFLTRCSGFEVGLATGSSRLAAAMQLLPAVYEPLLDPRFAPDYLQTLYEAHSAISFYTWSDDRCCLPQGTTSATLAGSYPDLQIGDVLLFEEVLGPITGEAGDANPNRRHVVRLTSVGPIPYVVQTDPLNGAEITQIQWALADALPFALCISSVTDEAHGSRHLSDVSIARGNLVLVDHGQTIGGDDLGTVPPVALYDAPDCNADRCSVAQPVAVPPRFRPQLGSAPLTQAAGAFNEQDPSSGTVTGTIPVPFDPKAPAAQVLDWSMDDVLPQIVLDSQLQVQGVPLPTKRRWHAQRTLLNSDGAKNEFVVEVDDNGAGNLRFGDNEHGLRPDSGTAFTATYRIGNGVAGNVGGESIVHFVAAGADLPNVVQVRNPLPASGGVDPESGDSVRRNAPQAFRTQERAVTTDDYAAVTERNPEVQRAAATLRWTGSWYTVFITVDPDAGVDPVALKDGLEPVVDCYRMAGQDLQFDDPHYVSLEIELHVCVNADYFRSDVEQRLLQVFSNRVLADGTRGVFHPDNFTFGQTVYLSPLYAAAHQVPGVDSAQITTFQRQGTDDPIYLVNGELPLNRLEIARLDNDLNFPEHGVLRLDIHGGK